MNILFYSVKCKYCHNIIKSLKQNDLIQYFKMYDINKLKKIPDGITKVPAIVSADTKKLYLAGEAFQWINSIKYVRNNTNIEQQQNNKLILNNNNERNNNQLGPKNFVSSEMFGISDDYAYISIDLAHPKNFQQYGTNVEDAIITPQENTSKINKNTLSKYVQNIEKLRDSQSKQFSEIMKQGQIEAVMKSGNYNNNN